MSKAIIALVNIGSNIEIEGLRLPNGTFAVSVSQVAALFSISPSNATKTTKALLDLDGLPNTISTLSSKPVNILSLSQLDTLTKILATKGNAKAQELLGISVYIKNKKSCESNGLIYVYLDSGNNAYKIGFTTDLAKRDRQHKTSNPFMTLVKTFKNKTLQHESIVHKALKSYRITDTSEWYENHPDVIKTLNRLI